MGNAHFLAIMQFKKSNSDNEDHIHSNTLDFRRPIDSEYNSRYVPSNISLTLTKNDWVMAKNRMPIIIYVNGRRAP